MLTRSPGRVLTHIEAGKHCSKKYSHRRNTDYQGSLSSCGEFKKHICRRLKTLAPLPRILTRRSVVAEAVNTFNKITFLFHFLFINLRMKEKYIRFTYPLIDVLDINRLKTDDTKE